MRNRKAKSARAQMALWNHLTREGLAAAKREGILNALELCYEEIKQFHATAYPDCDGGCPAHEAMAAAKKYLQEKET